MVKEKIKKLNILAIVFLLATTIGFLIYFLKGFPFHFFNHFFIGISTGIVILILLSLKKIDTSKFEWTMPFFLWIYAIIPEFIVQNGQHQKWENIFLFHYWFDGLLEKSLFILVVLFLVVIGLLLVYLKVRSNKNGK